MVSINTSFNLCVVRVFAHPRGSQVLGDPWDGVSLKLEPRLGWLVSEPQWSPVPLQTLASFPRAGLHSSSWILLLQTWVLGPRPWGLLPASTLTLSPLPTSLAAAVFPTLPAACVTWSTASAWVSSCSESFRSLPQCARNQVCGLKRVTAHSIYPWPWRVLLSLTFES